jgi:DNA polymerase III delta prime subunit
MNDDGHVFISYARADGRTLADRLYQALEGYGIPAWRDQRDLDPYQDFSAEIETAIQASSHVVVCLTPSIAKRKDSFVRREIIYAQGKVPISPVLFPGFAAGDIPILINHLTWLSFCDPANPAQLAFETGLSQLLGRLDTATVAHAPRLRDDAFRPYLQSLYQQLVAYLDSTVFALVSLGADSTAGAIEVDSRRCNTLPMSFFRAALPVKDVATKQSAASRPFDNIATAFADSDGQLLLLGDPGSGKTTTLMAFAREAVARRLEDPNEPLPLIGRIADWPRTEVKSVESWLASSLGLDQDAVVEAFREQQVLMLLDGLDEVGPAAGKHTAAHDPRAQIVESLRASLSGNQALVTCRDADFRSMGLKMPLRGAVALRPLNDGQLRQYLATQPALYRAIEHDTALREMVRTPLLLSLLAFAYAGSSSGIDSLSSLESAEGVLREEVFRAYVERRFEHERLRVNADLPFSLDEIYAVLGKAALENQDFSASWNHFSGITIEESIDGQLGERAGAFIDQAVRLHLLIRDEKGELRFIHLLVRDHFGFPFALDWIVSGKTGHWPQTAALLAETGDTRAVGALLKRGVRDGRVTHPAHFYLDQFADRRVVLPYARALSSEERYSREDWVVDDIPGSLRVIAASLGKQTVIDVLQNAMETAIPEEREDYRKALSIIG